MLAVSLNKLIKWTQSWVLGDVVFSSPWLEIRLVLVYQYSADQTLTEWICDTVFYSDFLCESNTHILLIFIDMRFYIWG